MWPFSRKIIDVRGEVVKHDGTTVGMNILDAVLVHPSHGVMHLRFPHVGGLRNAARSANMARRWDVIVTHGGKKHSMTVRAAGRAFSRGPMRWADGPPILPEQEGKLFQAPPEPWVTLSVLDDRTGEVVSLDSVGGFVKAVHPIFGAPVRIVVRERILPR